MKKFLLLAVVFTTLTAGKMFAEHRNKAVVLNINLPAYRSTQIMIDGFNYGFFQGSFSTNSLFPGGHTIQLISANQNYGYKRGGGHHHQQQNQVINTNVFLKPNMITTATVDPYYGLSIAETPIMPVHGQHHENDWNDDNEYGYDNGNNGGCTPPAPVICAVNEQAFCQFMNALRNAWFDSDKQKMACTFLAQNYVSSNQVYRILQQLDFESNRLAVAKEAFRKVVDKPNFYSVFDAFTFESSKRELNEMMSRGC